jgi:ATP-dependent DNA helicase RecG
MTGLPREGLRPGASSPALSSLEELPVRYARGVGPARAQLLERLGVRTVAELLYRLPRRLEDRSHLRPIAQLAGGTTDTVQGMVSRVTQFRPRRRRDLVLVKAAVTDGTGVLQAVWYNQPYLARQLPVGGRVILHGRVVRRGGEVQMVSPEFEVVEDGEDAETLHAGRIVPVYGSTEGLSQRTLRGIVARALDDHAGSVEEWMPAEILAHYGFPSLGEALREAHFPQSLPSWETARNRLVFEELLLFQLLVLRQRAAWTAETRAVPYGDAGPLLARFLGSLPYRLTAAQRRVLGEILRDLDGPHPMNRLLQGDVGSGKTVVAAAALLRAVGGGAQGALMAPTEILAEQHYLTLRRLLEPLGVTVQLLVGSLPRAERQEALARASDGRADVVVGTHALIEEDVAFHRLGLVVVDEQHRFGVAQRAALRRKGERPDVLVMTATPIPRTLALTLYGDLDVSVLDELPPGRSPIRTVHRAGHLRPKVYEFVRAQVAQGRQAYIVCPLIEESDKLQAEAATELASRLREGPLRGLRVEVVHGRLRVEERDRVMEALRAGEIDVLVATTVIEVGIDVPNATVMVIEDADRFGLAQLHQLRGRVGRGAHQSYCILVADPRTEEARARLRVMVETTDGFQIAQRDLELRGVGELLGGRRQHGISDFRVADLLRDHRWVERAREEALRIVAQDPALGRPEHRGLALALRARFGAAPAENAQVG